MSICPKNKSSKARRDSRRANWKMSVPSLSKCSKCGALVMPHRVCKACGAYNKKEVVKVQNHILQPSEKRLFGVFFLYSQAHGDGCLIKKAVFSEKLWYYIKVYAGVSAQDI